MPTLYVGKSQRQALTLLLQLDPGNLLSGCDFQVVSNGILGRFLGIHWGDTLGPLVMRSVPMPFVCDLGEPF